MKHITLLALLIASLLCSVEGIAQAQQLDLESLHPDHPARSEQQVMEILHYAFLWHYDRSFRTADGQLEELDIMFRGIARKLDPDDNSLFAEMWIPSASMLIELKLSDYRIEELNLDIRDDHFKVSKVIRLENPPIPLSEYQQHTIPFERLRAWYLDNIEKSTPLSDVLRKRLRETLIAHPFEREVDTSVNQVFNIAPISPACDDLWVFHENGNQLLLFSTDMDLSNPDYWKELPIHLTVYDLDPGVILAPEDMAYGTHRLSKDFVGRALFNCVVLGERIEVSSEQIQTFLEEKAARGN